MRISLLVARVFSFVAYHTPVRVGYLLADLAAIWMFLRFHGYRRAVMANLRAVYQGRLPERELRKRARWVFRTSSRNFWDLACLPYLDRDRLRDMHEVVEGDWALVDDALAQDSGVILLSSHVGGFDFIGQYVLSERYQPLVLTAPTVSKYVFAGVTFWRRSLGTRVEVVSAGSLRRLVRAVHNGELVAMIGDRIFGETGHSVSFFGNPTMLPAGAVKLARASGAPLIPVFAYRKSIQDRRREFVFHILDPIHIEQTENRDQDIERGMQRVVEVLEGSVARAPMQWVMFQPVWPEE